jgi:hypothetical protein
MLGIEFLFQTAGVVRMGRGGRREGAGRPKGCKDKKPRLSVKALVDMSRADQIKRGGVLPLVYMLKVMNDRKQPTDRRDRMAIAAAPFCHARLVYAEIKRPSAMTENELERAIAVAEEDLLRHGVGRDQWPRALH